MVITNDGLDAISDVVGNSGTAPSYIAIGTGSATVTVNDTTLDTEVDRNGITNTDRTIAANTTWIGDFSSTEMSGLNFQEFGMFNNGAGGNMFNHEVTGSIVFEGDRELQVQVTFRYV